MTSQDRINKAIEENNLQLAIKLINEDKNEEIKQLKIEIDNLKLQIKYLNEINNDNKKRRNSKVLKNLSNTLVQLLKNKRIDEFYKLFKENEFPIDEYLNGDVKINILYLVFRFNFITYSITNRK
jgi:hypothetical protein